MYLYYKFGGIPCKAGTLQGSYQPLWSLRFAHQICSGLKFHLAPFKCEIKSLFVFVFLCPLVPVLNLSGVKRYLS